MKKLNIPFVFGDQQRWDTVGCYSQKLDVTPNLDRMAKEGILFESVELNASLYRFPFPTNNTNGNE